MRVYDETMVNPADQEVSYSLDSFFLLIKVRAPDKVLLLDILVYFLFLLENICRYS